MTKPTQRPAKRGTPSRPQSKKIVNQRQTPWGLIAITAAVAALAVAVIGYAVTRNVAKPMLPGRTRSPASSITRGCRATIKPAC